MKQLNGIMASRAYATARRTVHDTDALTLQHQCDATSIAAPTGDEANRAAWFAERLRELGLQPEFDDVGNVFAFSPAADPAAACIVVASHLDTVFDAGTPLDIVRDGGRLLAPGISDNARGLAGLLALARFDAGVDLFVLRHDPRHQRPGQRTRRGAHRLGATRDHAPGNGDDPLLEGTRLAALDRQGQRSSERDLVPAQDRPELVDALSRQGRAAAKNVEALSLVPTDRRCQQLGVLFHPAHDVDLVPSCTQRDGRFLGGRELGQSTRHDHRRSVTLGRSCSVVIVEIGHEEITRGVGSSITWDSTHHDGRLIMVPLARKPRMSADVGHGRYCRSTTK